MIKQVKKYNYAFASATFLGCLSSVRTSVEFRRATAASSMPRATRRRRCTLVRLAFAPADFVGRDLLVLRSSEVAIMV